MNGLFIFNYLHYVKNAYLDNYFFAGLFVHLEACT